MPDLTTSQKGAAAEAEVAAAPIRMHLLVLRPWVEGGRYDLGIDIGRQLLRVQCKWASPQGDVLTASCRASRHTPRGYLRTTYAASEVDAIGLYAPSTDRCYLIPIDEIEGLGQISLRVAATRNKQALLIRWARDFEFRTSLRRNWGVECAPQASRGKGALRAIR
jgi:PD-(D/E)XK endonuclease